MKYTTMTLAVLVTYLSLMVFDATVTYTVYKTIPARFYDMEANRGVVEWLYEGAVPWMQVSAKIAPLIGFAAVLWSMGKTNTPRSVKFTESMWLALVIITLVSAGMHLAGGMSWLI